MQGAIFVPWHPGHLRHLLVYFKALGLEFLRAGGGQLQAQFPGEQPQALGFGLEGFVQALGAVLRRGFAPGPASSGLRLSSCSRNSGRCSRNLPKACSCGY